MLCSLFNLDVARVMQNVKASNDQMQHSKMRQKMFDEHINRQLELLSELGNKNGQTKR